MPTSMIATINSEVPTGRSMKSRDGFMSRPDYWFDRAGRPAPPPGGAAATGEPDVPLGPAEGLRILAPSRSRSVPSMTTWSPTCRPFDHRDPLTIGDAEFDDADLDGVVGLDQIDEDPGLAALDGGDGNDGRILHRVDQQADIHELVGEQALVLVVENGAQLHGAGGHVDQVVGGVELADAQFDLLRAVEGAHLERCAGLAGAGAPAAGHPREW